MFSASGIFFYRGSEQKQLPLLPVGNQPYRLVIRFPVSIFLGNRLITLTGPER
jgi:hypothetical protein